MYLMNRLANTKNPYQGESKRVLAVCSAGLLRSPTVAEILSREPFNHNTRAAGISKEFALIAVDEVLIHWADEIVCMTEEQGKQVQAMSPPDKTILVLGVPDSFAFRDPELVKLVTERYAALVKQCENS